MKLKLLLLFQLFFLMSSCLKHSEMEVCKQINKDNKYKPVTIFVHGTVPIQFKLIVHSLDSPFGLMPAKVQGNSFFLVHRKIGYILDQADNKQFPLDSFYLYGWPSKLSFLRRYKIAKQLYQDLKQFKGPITLIGHSHGGNVILNLARVAQELNEENSSDINIEKVILLAVPVQEDTKDYIKSPLFKHIYSFYSTGDRTQMKDPQWFYRDIRAKYADKNIPCYSGRKYQEYKKLKQVRLLLHGRNPQHLDFLYKPFLSRLPEIITLTDKIDLNNKSKEYVINIPNKGSPELMEKNR